MDRREDIRLRFPVEIDIYGRSEIGLFEGFKTTLINIGHEGVSFELPISLDKKKRYNADIELRPGAKFQAHLNILWVKQLPSKKFLHGAELSYFSEEQMNELALFFENAAHKPEARIEERRASNRRDLKAADADNKEQRISDRRLLQRYLSESAKISLTSKKPRILELKRVVITGIGVVAPNAIGKKEFLAAIKSSKSGIRAITHFDAKDLPSRYAGEVSDELAWNFLEELLKDDPDTDFSSMKTKFLKRTDRPVQFGLIAAMEALHDSGLNIQKMNRKHIGISTGTSMAGLAFAFKEHDKYFSKGMHKMNPYTIAAASANPSSGELSAELKLRGPAATFSQGCTSGTSAISFAYQQIQQGKALAMLAGGTDSPLYESTFAAFCRSGMLAPSMNGTPTLPRPMDKNRTGIVLAEGAAILVLEELGHALARGAHIYGEILAASNTCDGYDMVKWRWHGSEAARAIRNALEEAEITIDDVSLIYAQATGSHEGDNMELRAIKKVFGAEAKKIPVTNVKGMIGYSQAACAAIETVAACLSLDTGIIPAIPSLTSPHESVNLSAKVRHHSVDKVLINCFGFGGKNQCLVLSKLT